MAVSSIEILRQDTDNFTKSVKHLEVSISRCKELKHTLLCEFGHESEYNLPVEYVERIETLYSRFSRCIDMLIYKVLYSIEMAELGKPRPSPLDVVLMAEKKGFVDTHEELIELKDIRNELAHEYIEDVVIRRFDEIFEASTKLVEISHKVIGYVEDKLLSTLEIKR